MTVVIIGFIIVNNNVWTHRLGGVQPVWNWHGKVRHLHDPWLVWKQILYGNCHQEIRRKSSSFFNGWQRRFHLLQITTNQNVNRLTCRCGCRRVGQRVLHSVQQSVGSQRYRWWQHHGRGIRYYYHYSQNIYRLFSSELICSSISLHPFSTSSPLNVLSWLCSFTHQSNRWHSLSDSKWLFFSP